MKYELHIIFIEIIYFLIIIKGFNNFIYLFDK